MTAEYAKHLEFPPFSLARRHSHVGPVRLSDRGLAYKTVAETHEHRLSSDVSAAVLVAAMAIIAGALGALLFGAGGAAALVAFSVFAGLLGSQLSVEHTMRLHRGRELFEHTAPRLFRMVRMLTRQAGLKTPPRLFYVPSQQLNAFAVGTDDESGIGITAGLLHTMTERELEGVLAHEISHIKNHDIRVMAVGELFSRATSLLSDFGLFLALLSIPFVLLGAFEVSFGALALLLAAPTVSSLVQLALSRTREFGADASAAELTGDPRGLAMALAKLERAHSRFGFAWLKRKDVPEWLRTHPATRERIKRLLSMEVLELLPESVPGHVHTQPAYWGPKTIGLGLPTSDSRH